MHYNHPSTIQRARIRIDRTLQVNPTKDNDWYVDKLIHNYDFACKALYECCKFIYMVRSPLVPLATLISRGYPPQGAETYYLFRLRRMCEMARHTDGVLLTYEDLTSKRVFPLLQNTFGLKSPLTAEFKPMQHDDGNLSSGRILTDPVEPNAEVPQDVLERCQFGYNKYLNFMENKTGLIRYAI